MNSLVYEKPTLKNYGTMKSITLGLAGSGGDSMGASNGGVSPLQDGPVTTGSATDVSGANPVDSPEDAHDGATAFQSDN
ncbi:MAG: hypothetical protein QNJ51_03730 [Calothrix sp. MO_167.B12]|nr:hypothetical protein [Calothrix sp. MO_167.B12]